MKKSSMKLDVSAGSLKIQMASLPLKNAVVVSDADVSADPGKISFRSAKKIAAGPVFYLEDYTKKTGCALVRCEFTVGKIKELTVGAGADWYMRIWLDGEVVIDRMADGCGNGRTICDYTVERKLSAGKHVIHALLKRGIASATLALAVYPQNMVRREVLVPFENKELYMRDRIRTGIEANRKAVRMLRFYDVSGKPLDHVHVKAVQKTHDFQYGANIFMLEEFKAKEQNEAYKKYFRDAFNLATLPFYWADLEPVQGKPRFAKNSPKIYRRPTPDLCLEFCEKYGITPKAHCLNYPPFTPSWVPADLQMEKMLLTKRFAELSERYSRRICDWEVTNEFLCPNRRGIAIHDAPDGIEWSFKTAERFFPGNTLIINEATHNIWNNSLHDWNRDRYYMQIERALLKGARIDKIGMQYHMFFRRESEVGSTALYYDPEELCGTMDAYAALGRPLQVTELTVPAYSNTPEDEAIQAEILRNLYSIWFSHKAMTGIVYWNLIDGFAAFAPQGDMKAGENYYYGGLLRYDFSPKPSYTLIRDLFRKEWHTEAELDSECINSVAFKGFYGTYDLEITCGDKVWHKDFHLQEKSGNAATDIVLE